MRARPDAGGLCGQSPEAASTAAATDEVPLPRQLPGLDQDWMPPHAATTAATASQRIARRSPPLPRSSIFAMRKYVLKPKEPPDLLIQTLDALDHVLQE